MSIVLPPGEELLRALEEIMVDLPPDVTIYSQGHPTLPSGVTPLEELLLHAPETNMDRTVRSNARMSDVICYIYTSGTTGKLFILDIYTSGTTGKLLIFSIYMSGTTGKLILVYIYTSGTTGKLLIFYIYTWHGR